LTYCLPKHLAVELKKRIVSKEINPSQLENLGSEGRRKYFAEFLGEENAKNTNVLIERKLLMKHKKEGIITALKTITGMKPEIQRDLITRVQRMDERILNPAEENQFLDDLAERSLGFGVTEAEAKEIFNLSQEVKRTKAAVDRKTKNGSTSRIDYGKALVNFKNKVESHKVEAAKKTFKQRMKLGNLIIEASGTAKSLLASWDNSFYGRQGLKVLFNSPKDWAEGFMKSWGDIGRGLVSGNAIDLVKAEVYSRENAMNGNYQKMGIDIGIGTEEEFPSSLPDRIPILGRVFRASEVAFNGGALRMRALYADTVLQAAQRGGVDITDRKILKDYGKLVNSMTGRGDIGKLGAFGKEVNILLFSAKYLKSSVETFTMPLDSNLDPAVRKQAAVNLMRVIAGIASILAIAKMLDPESVELDPRSSDFGKIIVGKTRFNITGGMGSLVTLAARLVPTSHNGKFSLWSKSVGGNYQDLTSGEYGQRNAMDVMWGFFENKASPVAGVVRDVWKGQTFDFEKPTVLGELKNLTVPISLNTYKELMEDKENSPVLAGMLMETLGIGVSTYN